MWPLGSGGPGTTGYDLSCREPGSALRSRYPHQPGSARPAAVPGLANIPAPAAAATSEAVSCGCQPRLPWPRVPGGGGGGGGTMVEAAQLHPRPLHGTRPRSHRHHTSRHTTKMAAWRSGVQLLPPPARITIRQPRPAHPAAPRDTPRGTRGTCSQASPCSSWCAAWPRCAWRPRRRVCCPAPLSTVPGPWSQAPPPWPAAETEMEPHHHQLLGLSLLAATQHQPPAVRQL